MSEHYNPPSDSNPNREPLPKVWLDLLEDIEFPPVPFLSDGELLSSTKEHLAADGELVNDWFFNQLDDTRFLNGLQAYCETIGTQVMDYFRHSNRFAGLDRRDGLFDRNKMVTLPEGPENLKQDGTSRRSEEGHPMDFDYIHAEGIDPERVLYFRATQPMQNEPKPEYYWTSDLREVKNGLGVELGSQASTAIILVSTLKTISHNCGLIEDVNDDSGVAVRQIGLEPFDQRDAMFTICR